MKSGKETRCTYQALSRIIERALHSAGLPVHAVQMISHTEPDWLRQFAGDTRVDLIIPCGTESLVKDITESARVPVLKHYRGVCQAFVHSTADLDKAEKIVVNSKCPLPESPTALDNLFIDAACAEQAVPQLCGALHKNGVEIRGDERVRALFAEAKEATAEDFRAEHLGLVLTVAVAENYEAALKQMRIYSSGHTEMLMAEDDILQGVTGQAPYQMGYDAFNTALDALAGKSVEEYVNTPTIFFGRGDDAMIQQFMDTEGQAIFE